MSRGSFQSCGQFWPHKSNIGCSALVNRCERCFRTLVELLRGGARFFFPRKHSDRDALWFRCQVHKLDPITTQMTKHVRRCCYSITSGNSRIHSDPAVVLLHEARFILHGGEKRGDVFRIARVLLWRESDKSFASRRWLDTFLAAPGDICPIPNALPVAGSSYLVHPRSIVALARIAK
jgi:hypothetical protein